MQETKTVYMYMYIDVTIDIEDIIIRTHWKHYNEIQMTSSYM